MAPTTSAAEEFARLVELVRVLRSPEGCPWDREQTLQTLRPFVLEETYEVLEALDRDDRAALREELGDFIFEAVLLAQLCAETRRLHRRRLAPRPSPTSSSAGTRTSSGRPDGTRRAARSPRRPTRCSSAGKAMKATETSDSGTPRTTLGGVPASLPSLLRAHEIGMRAAAVGSTGNAPSDVVAKIEEEVAELRETIEPGGSPSRERAEEEMGDLLFAIANLSRKLGIEPESALRQANEKFTRRFSAMEAAIRRAAARSPPARCRTWKTSGHASRPPSGPRGVAGPSLSVRPVKDATFAVRPSVRIVIAPSRSVRHDRHPGAR